MQDDRLYDEKELEKSWLISYSDLFTLLFVIILIVAASSSAHLQSKWEQVKQAEAAQREQADETAERVKELTRQKEQLQQEIAVLEAKRDAFADAARPQGEEDGVEQRMEVVKTQLAAALSEFHISFEESPEGIVVRFPEKVLFDSGSAEVKADGKQAIAAFAAVLKRFPHRVRIEGYTDNVPVANSRYPSNWELSSARAIAVMRELVDVHGLPASRFMVAGWGEYNPVAPNDTPEHRALNRRVEVVILAETDVP